MVATPRLLQANSNSTGDYSILLSANANTGGACNGDSGGPNFIGDSNVIGAVTSSAKSTLCKGSSGSFRMDRSWALDWVGHLPLTVVSRPLGAAHPRAPASDRLRRCGP